MSDLKNWTDQQWIDRCVASGLFEHVAVEPLLRPDGYDFGNRIAKRFGRSFLLMSRHRLILGPDWNTWSLEAFPANQFEAPIKSVVVPPKVECVAPSSPRFHPKQMRLFDVD